MSGLFLGTALLSMTTAGCDDTTCDDDDPTIRFIFIPMRSSSLLAAMGSLSGFVGALFMPLLGAIVDHTPYRRGLAISTALCLVLINTLQASATTGGGWHHIAVLQVVAGWIGMVHGTAKYAYLPEMEDEVPMYDNVNDVNNANDANNANGTNTVNGTTNATHAAAKEEAANPTSTVVSRVTSLNTGVSFLAQFLFLAAVIAMSLALAPPAISPPTALSVAQEDVGTSRISQITTAVTSAVMYWWAWSRLPSRSALHALPGGESVCSAGFYKLRKTARGITRKHPALATFLAVTAMSEAAVNAFTTVAVTYCKVVIGMSATESGILFAVVLLAGFPGAFLSEKYVTGKVGCFRSFVVCCAAWTVVTMLAPVFLDGPGSKPAVFVFGAVWGGLMGWYYPANASTYVSLVPRGQESEMMGLFIFVGQVVVWLPPLVFGLLNENGVSMSWGLVVDALFFGVAGAVCWFGIGQKGFEEGTCGHAHTHTCEEEPDEEEPSGAAYDMGEIELSDIKIVDI